MKKLLLTLILVIAFIFQFPVTIVHAAILNKTFTREYTVNDDYVAVKETKQFVINQASSIIPADSPEEFTIFNPIAVDKDRAAKLKKTKDSIKLVDSDGNNINFTTEDTKEGNLTVKLVFPRDVDILKPYSLTLTYDSYGLLIKSGSIRDVYVPAFVKNYQFSDNNSSEEIYTSVIIPNSLGEINFALPQNSQQKSVNETIINYKKEDLLGQTAWIQVGTAQNYSFEVTQPYKGSSLQSFTENIYKVVIPRDIKSGPITQKVYYSEISPKPYSVTEDDNGNLIAEFRFPSNQSGNIEVKGYATISQDNSVNFKNSGKISDIPKEIIDQNTLPAKYWEVDNQKIKDTIKEIFKDKDLTKMSVYDISQAVYKFVVDKIDYSTVKRFGINERQGALATLEGGAAVCMEYSDLYITLMRAAGVPARAAFGYGYSALDNSDASDNTINHQWAEVYIPSIKSWIGVDTTWGENGNILIGGDLNHFYTHVASMSPNDPTTVAKSVGSLGGILDRGSKVSVIDKFSLDSLQTEGDLLTKFAKPNEITFLNISQNNLVFLSAVAAMLVALVLFSGRARKRLKKASIK